MKWLAVINDDSLALVISKKTHYKNSYLLKHKHTITAQFKSRLAT